MTLALGILEIATAMTVLAYKQDILKRWDWYLNGLGSPPRYKLPAVKEKRRQTPHDSMHCVGLDSRTAFMEG